ncbi:MAG: protein kinase [Deltaproteobacteria bacterium]|nr:protein kinase [Deltaproteobacteria bacterium]
MEAMTVCASCGAREIGRPRVCQACGEDPRVAGTYRLEGELGRGGTGVTWRARREPGGEPVCLKELRWASMESLDDDRRFAREGDLLAALDHPAIPHHYGAFSWGEGRAHARFIAQELVVGDNLEVERKTRGYTTDEVLQVGVELADVLTYLHERHPPVVHRDLKPSNIMRRVDGRLVLIDFGAARVDALTGASSQVSVAGTFGFMAPEQMRGQAGPAADVYGLGMTLGVLSAGGPPEALLDANNRPELDRIPRLRRDVRALLGELCALDPAERPTARQVAQRCRSLLAGPHEVAPRSPPPRALTDASPARRGLVAGLVIGAALAIIALVFGGIAFLSATFDKPPATVASSAEVVTASAPVAPSVAVLPEPAEASPSLVVPDVAAAPGIAALASDCAEGKADGCAGLVEALGDQRAEVLALPGWPRPLEAGCGHGVGAACLALARVRSQGLGVEASRIQTRAAFGQACEAGVVEGCGSYGHMLLKGDGGPADWKAARVPLAKACDQGDDESCLSVGAIDAEGKNGAKVDRANAMSIFEGLCRKGLTVACENVDAMVGNDWGLPPSGLARRDALERLCAMKSGAACVRLGDLYRRGTTGVPKDAARAGAAFTKGCDVGSKVACERLR